MITVYFYNGLRVYTHEEELDPMGPIPINVTLEAPPELVEGEYARWVNSGWEVLTELPEVVIPETVVMVPENVSRAQGKAALILAGTWDAVTQYVEGIEDNTTKLLAETALYDTQEWRRDSPFLVECAAALGMSSEDLDELFINAAEIEL